MSTRPPARSETSAVPRLSWENVLAWRMARQQLQRRVPAGSALDVVAGLCGLHAQVMSSAELTLWTRVEGLANDATERMLWDDRSLAKTWAMRGTLHLLPATELPHWVATRSVATPRYHAPSWQQAFGVSRAEMETVLAAMPAVLDRAMLTREELAHALAGATGLPPIEERLSESWGSVLKPLAFAGTLCFAPNAGRAVRFTRPDQWLGSWQTVAPDAAMATIVRRYLHSYGPATRDEFSRWFGSLSPAQAERQIKRLGDEVATVEIAGARAWALAADLDAMSAMRPSGVIRLLPAFDQYVVTAPRDEPAVLATAMRGRVYRPQAWFSPVVLEDGRMIGTWRHERNGTKLAVAMEPFARLTPRQKDQIADEAERLAGYLDGNLSLTFAAPP